MRKTLTRVMTALALVSLTASQAVADPPPLSNDDLVPDEVKSKKKKDEDEKGRWIPSLAVGLGLSFSHSHSVVGQLDGESFSFAPALDAGIFFVSKMHEWHSTLVIRHMQSLTPAFDEFVKTADNLKLDSLYMYIPPAVPWLGPFVLVSLETPIFNGKDQRATPVVYRITELDGTATNSALKNSLALTRAWSPLLLKQSLGAFARPVNKPHVVFLMRAGVGAREALVRDGLVVNDDDKTPEVEVKRIEDYQKVGGEFFAGVSGTVTFEKLGKDRPLLYSASAEVLVPFYSSIDRGNLNDRVDVNLEAKLSVKLFAWMSLDYQFKAVRETLQLKEFQIQNNLLLNFSYAIVAK